MNSKVFWIGGLITALMVLSCGHEEEFSPMEFPELMEIPEGFPAIEEPVDNKFTTSRWELGKRLFFDPIMSVDSSISCASCHKAHLAFSDDMALSTGVNNRLGNRNAPSLANVSYHPYFTREGGVPSLEMQVLVPIQESHEFDFNILLLADRLQKHPEYVAMSQAAYGRQPDPFVITRALACFERSLLSGDSPYDRFVNHKSNRPMSDEALLGMELFFSDRTSCSNCHSGFNFSNYSFENNGLYSDYEDPGRMRLTSDQEDRAMFKVPSLRNIELTAPYMHDGSIFTLREVIEHYDSGGSSHPNKNELIRPLNLNEGEKSALVEFLRSLTDLGFTENPLFQSK